MQDWNSDQYMHAMSFQLFWLFVAPWTVTHQSPLSLAFPRQEYWSGLPFPFPGDLPNPGIKPGFLSLLHWQASSLTLTLPGKFPYIHNGILYKVKVTQSSLTLCDPMDYTVHGILQARRLEWVAFSFSRGSSQLRDQTQVSHIAGGFFTSWATREAQEYWSG